MAKNSYQRAQVERLQAKWTKIAKAHHDPEFGGFVPEGSLSFGAIFNKDPMDCGRSNCGVCGAWLHRQQNRSERRQRHMNDHEISQYWFEEL